MAWSEVTRREHDRRALRYASDCTDAEWALVGPFMPAPSAGPAACDGTRDNAPIIVGLVFQSSTLRRS